MNIFEGGRRIAKVIAATFIIPLTFGAAVRIFNGDATSGGELIGYAIGCFAFFWTGVCALGWIVRGFLRIPRGEDYRVESAYDRDWHGDGTSD